MKIKYVEIVLLLLVFSSGCTPMSAPFVCRHEAPSCAVAWQQKYGDEIRVASGIMRGHPHGAAQAKIDGKWEFLRLENHRVVRTPPPFGFIVQRYRTIKEYIKSQWWINLDLD